MNPEEARILRSFKNLKSDVIELQNLLVELSQSQEELMKEISNVNEKSKIVKTLKTKGGAQHFVGSKTGKKFHIPQCPFAKNIKPKSKIIFKSKTEALNKGYKPDSCVTKG